MAAKRKQRAEREREVLLGLVELYLLTGKPVGSNTLKENGFDNISSATIRNYFAILEKEGYLMQQHSSGGRIPTSLAYKLYANFHINSCQIDPKDLALLQKELNHDTREIAGYLQNGAELLSNLTQGAVFLSAPRFDQDIIIDIKLVGIDAKRCLIVVITDFGLVHTEILYTPKKLSSFSLKRIESYFHFRLTGLDRPKLNQEEEDLASNFYNEIMMRHIVGYSNFSAIDIYKTGFSKLLRFPEFQDATVLATGLSIFENTSFMRKLLGRCTREGDLKVWIGDDIHHPSASIAQSSIIAIPYYIHGKAIGAIALLGPIRMPYPKLFGILRTFSQILSEVLTRNLYKYKITYRQPKSEQVEMQTAPPKLIKQDDPLQLEDKT
ncbi:MAG: heat-inducible transcriptional repressor HrcA [Simkaniaceae bacterium]|nr:MAG: heat-inducible transcriptional repressor HrcA [Simkaniaceae bacterium]